MHRRRPRRPDATDFEPCRANRAFVIAAAITAAIVAPHLASAADFIFANSAGGDLNVSTNYSPPGTPGAADSLKIEPLANNTGFMTLYVAANQSIGRIESGHYAPNTIDAKLNFTTPYVLTLSLGQIAFTDSITETPGGAPLTSLFLLAPVAGGAGLTKTGPGFALLGGANLYTGGTTITGNGATGIAGGLSISNDTNLGAAGTLNFSNFGTLRALSSFTSTRAITVSGGGRIESFGDLVLNGNITGTGPLTIGRFTSGSVTLGGVIGSAVPVTISNGGSLSLTGRASGAVTVAGTLNLGRPTVGPSSNALDDAATFTSQGGTINVYGSAANNTETVGPLTLANGTTTLDLEPTVNGGIQLGFASLARQNRSTMFVRGRDLGIGALAADRALVTFANTSGLTQIGGNGTTATNDSIVPFLLGNANVTGGASPVSVVDAGFVTLTANGLRVLDATDYATSLTTAAAQDNVRLTDAAFTLNTSVTVNSLVIRDTNASNGNTGVGGTGAITITSGAIAAVSDIAGEELFIDNSINFGSAEGVLHTAPTSDGQSLLILRGVIRGTGGFTKSGAGELDLENTASTVTGTITVNGGLVSFAGNVPANGVSSLGDGGAVVINPGATANGYVGLRATTPLSVFARPITVHQSSTDNNLALLGTYGGYGTTFSGAITIDGGFLNLLGDLETDVLTLSGSVFGAGGLQDPAVATPLPQYIRVTGAISNYSGGTVIRAGRWEVGSNVALGTGTVYFDGNGSTNTATQTGSLQAFGGAQSLANPLVFRAAPIFSGANALTFTGPIDLGSVARDVTVTNTADTTFAGVVSRGGLSKRGAGRLILSGPNTYNGQTLIAEGILRAANNAALGESTGPTGTGQATFIIGSGILELAGGITSPEAIYFGANGLPITAAAPAGNLRSVSGNNTITSSVAFDNLATIGVDAGSMLTLTGDTNDNTSLGNAILRKVGAGTLAVKNVRLPTLTIDAGQLRISAAGAPLGTSRVSTLNIAPGSVLDITNNTFVIDYPSTSPQPTVIASLLAGRIITSTPTPGAAVGYAEAATLFPGATFPQSYAGQSFDATTLILTETLKGDSNLDHTVNFDDLLALAQNYGTTGRVWFAGDFDYNGTVDFDDLLALAQNYNHSALVNGSTSELTATFAADWALAQSLVPEPTTLIVLAAMPWMRRARRG